MSKIICTIFLSFFLSSVSWGGICQSFYFSAISRTEKAHILHALNQVYNFLNAKVPIYDQVRPDIEFLSSLDLRKAKYTDLVQPVSKSLQKISDQILAALPKSGMSIVQIQNQSNKLRMLNNPVLRNLLKENQQVQISRRAWIYNFAIWNWRLDINQKVDKILNDIALISTDIKFNPDEKLKLPEDLIEIIQDGIEKTNADAMIASVECNGFCGSEIHKYVKENLPSEYKNRELKDGEALSIMSARSMVFVADNYKLPLHEIVTNALLEAEKAGHTSVALPALRSGYAFGAIESSQAEVSYEVLKGISEYVDKGKGVIKKIYITIPKNEVLVEYYKNWILQSKKSFERSLRHNLRIANFSGKSFTITPNPKGYQKEIQKEAPIYRTMMLPWDLKRMKEIYAPLELGTLKNPEAFAAPTTSVLNMPIKMPGLDIRVPIELENFREFLQLVFDHEVKTNPHWGEFFVYLTVDQSPVFSGKTQRQPGIHIDGVQGARYPVKLPPEHTYSASNTLGTIFYPQSYDLAHVNPNTDHVHNVIWDQTNFNNRIITKDFEVYFWNSYSPHEAQVSTINIPSRTFVRVEFSKKIYGSHGDTMNPLFNYDWKSEHRPVPADLFK